MKLCFDIEQTCLIQWIDYCKRCRRLEMFGFCDARRHTGCLLKKASLYRDHKCLLEKRAAFPGNSAADVTRFTHRTEIHKDFQNLTKIDHSLSFQMGTNESECAEQRRRWAEPSTYPIGAF
jgi:hypothetical protein